LIGRNGLIATGSGLGAPPSRGNALVFKNAMAIGLATAFSV
jgi:hypothetical protein